MTVRPVTSPSRSPPNPRTLELDVSPEILATRPRLVASSAGTSEERSPSSYAGHSPNRSGESGLAVISSWNRFTIGPRSHTGRGDAVPPHGRQPLPRGLSSRITMVSSMPYRGVRPLEVEEDVGVGLQHPLVEDGASEAAPVRVGERVVRAGHSNLTSTQGDTLPVEPDDKYR